MVKKTLTAISDEDVEKIEKATKVEKITVPKIAAFKEEIEITSKEISIPETVVTTEIMPGANERKITVSFDFNASKVEKEDVDIIASEVLRRSKGKLIQQLEQVVVSEQKWLDKTRT